PLMSLHAIRRLLAGPPDRPPLGARDERLRSADRLRPLRPSAQAVGGNMLIDGQTLRGTIRRDRGKCLMIIVVVFVDSERETAEMLPSANGRKSDVAAVRCDPPSRSNAKSSFRRMNWTTPPIAPLP